MNTNGTAAISAEKYNNNSKLIELDEELTQYYLEHIPVNLTELKKAYATMDIPGIRFQSHKLVPAMVLIDKLEIAESLKKLSDKTVSVDLMTSITKNVINEIETVLNDLSRPLACQN